LDSGHEEFRPAPCEGGVKPPHSKALRAFSWLEYSDWLGKAPKKLRGCIAAPPRVPFGFWEELTSSFLLSFSLPFYSPPNFLNFTPALLAERVFNLMYSDTALSCQEESEVCTKKNTKTEFDSLKNRNRPGVFRVIDVRVGPR
jgi:hypothetical protein